MGVKNSKSKSRNRVIQTLLKNTYFTKEELELWYKGFMKEYPSGMIGREQFNNLYDHCFPYGDASRFASFFFLLFDHNEEGLIGFNEFIAALSVATRGTLDEKIAWTFRLYDQDKDGYVTKGDMFNIIDSIYEMVDPYCTLPFEEENTPVKRVDQIFSIMGKGDDEALSLDEFIAGCKTNDKILQALNSFSEIA